MASTGRLTAEVNLGRHSMIRLLLLANKNNVITSARIMVFFQQTYLVKSKDTQNLFVYL